MISYHHTQGGRTLILLLLCMAAIVAIIGFIVPARPMSFVVPLILLFTAFIFSKLTIRIDHDTLCASFGPGLIKKEVSVAEIVAAEPIRIRWWYGWGIHLTPYGWLYNIGGWDAVVIALRSGRKFALGTDDPHGLVAAIRRFASAK